MDVNESFGNNKSNGFMFKSDQVSRENKNTSL